MDTAPVITFQDIDYSALRQGLNADNDRYGILHHEYENRRLIFLQNPNLIDDKKPYMYVAYADGTPVARCLYYETKIKIDDKVYSALSGSALSVVKEYRKYAIGTDILIHNTFRDDYDYKVFAGISAMALPLYKKVKYKTFFIPRYILRYNYKSKIQQKGLSGLLLNGISAIVNRVLNYRYYLNNQYHRLSNRFTVVKMDTVPEWVDDMVMNDGHQYMEVHDHRWLQWNLTGCFSGNHHQFQSFYGIYDGDKPVGFFLTKERQKESTGMITGGIYEWGSLDEGILSEADIYELAIPTFSKDIYIIDAGTVNSATAERMKRLGFKYTNDENIVFYSSQKQNKDINDASLWRLRLGYADTVFF